MNDAPLRFVLCSWVGVAIRAAVTGAKLILCVLEAIGAKEGGPRQPNKDHEGLFGAFRPYQGYWLALPPLV